MSPKILGQCRRRRVTVDRVLGHRTGDQVVEARRRILALDYLAGQLLFAWNLWKTARTPKPYDYSAFLAHMPRSILVLPPVNDSIEAGAANFA